MSRLLELALRVKHIAQTGKTYGKDAYDLERYEELNHLAFEMIGQLGCIEADAIKDCFSLEKGYPTPKVDTRGAIFDGDKILLVREKSDGCWTLPGGWADQGCTPSENVLREIREESGYRAKNPKLIAVIDRGAHPYRPIYLHHIYKLFFICEVEGKDDLSTDNTEISELGFFALNELPALSEDRVLRQDLERLFEYRDHPNRPVYVD